MKRYPARLSISGKYRLWRFINCDTTCLLSQLKEKKVIKKKEITDVMTAVEESNTLVQRAQKLSDKIVASESDGSERECKGLFDSSKDSNNNDEVSCTELDSSLEDSNNNDEVSCTKLDDSISSCAKKTGLSKPGNCNFTCNFPKFIYTTDDGGTKEPLVYCVRCLICFHFNCQYVEYSECFNDVINDHFADGTKICHDCCLEFYELKLHSKTGHPQRTSVCKQIYTVARTTVTLIPIFTLV